MLHNNKGFTLVELAIVLIIIGVILGAVLKGQELIDNAKIKRAITDMNTIFVAYNGYIDRYQKKPGDDGDLATLNNRSGAWSAVTVAGNVNGTLAATAANTFTNGAAETTSFWQHVKAAGFVTGAVATTGTAALPVNGYNGLVGVFNNTTALTGAGTGINVCLSQVPGKAAAAIDKQLDDGLRNSGSIRATISAAGTNTAPGAANDAVYDEGLEYSLCRSL